jgi:probable rRNA maturation factor
MTTNRADVCAMGLELPAWADGAARFALRVCGALGCERWDVSLVFCTDAFIRDLNRRYRGKDEATDVLSFPQDGPPAADGTLNAGELKTGKLKAGELMTGKLKAGKPVGGDIVISLETLAENCKAFGVDMDEELRRLLIHGILHLSGLDHATLAPDEPMLALQEELLAELAAPPMSN